MLIPFDYLFKKYRIKAKGVLHLGANTGQEAEAYRKQGIKDVFWVEAIPSVHAQLESHIARFPGNIALRACVSDVDGKVVTFNVASNQGQSSSFLEFGTHTKEHPTVKFVEKLDMRTIRVDTLLSHYNIVLRPGWFLNVDLQGAELLALKGMGLLLDNFDYVYIEVNEKELYKGCPLVGEVDAYLGGFGFHRREILMTGSGWGDAFFDKTC